GVPANQGRSRDCVVGAHGRAPLPLSSTRIERAFNAASRQGERITRAAGFFIRLGAPEVYFLRFLAFLAALLLAELRRAGLGASSSGSSSAGSSSASGSA